MSPEGLPETIPTNALLALQTCKTKENYKQKMLTFQPDRNFKLHRHGSTRNKTSTKEVLNIIQVLPQSHTNHAQGVCVK